MMDKRSVIDLIHSLNVSEDILVLDGSLRDGYCVRRNGHRWEVLVRERGTESDVMGFPSEEDALRYLAEILMRTYR